MYILHVLWLIPIRFSIAAPRASSWWKWERKCDKRVSISYTQRCRFYALFILIHSFAIAWLLLLPFLWTFFFTFSDKIRVQITVTYQNNLMATTHALRLHIVVHTQPMMLCVFSTQTPITTKIFRENEKKRVENGSHYVKCYAIQLPLQWHDLFLVTVFIGKIIHFYPRLLKK